VNDVLSAAAASIRRHAMESLSLSIQNMLFVIMFGMISGISKLLPAMDCPRVSLFVVGGHSLAC
jgi:hypothetical protein